jgi:D-glycero-beta-D-manno-heptose-7-phosphate kinase
MIDHFLWGSVSRISPEAPVPVVRAERESHCLGGAGNVVRNLVALGARAIPVGVCGEDRDGDHLRGLCRETGVSTDGVIVASARPTTVKTRVIAHQQQVVRVDRETDGPLSKDAEDAVLERALAFLGQAEALIVSDYDKGTVSPGLLAKLLPAASKKGIPIVIDPKVRHFALYRPATVVTPNAREAMEAAGAVARDEGEFEAIGRKLLSMLECPYLLMTRGDRGMLLQRSGGASISIPAAAREVFDVTGAGDTVAATLALGLASGATMEEAAVLANRAAGVVVGKLGTATLTVGELLHSLAAPDEVSGAR